MSRRLIVLDERWRCRHSVGRLTLALVAGGVLMSSAAAQTPAPPSLAPLNAPANRSAPRPAAQQPPPLAPNAPLFTLPGPGEEGPARPGPSGEPDLSALRYYIQARQKDRDETEIARIQRLYPGWRPPADIWDTTEANTSDEGPYWALYTADRIPELKAAIQAKMSADPGWQPSRDLMRKLRRKELRVTIERMAREGQQKQIVSYVRQSAIPPGDIDIDILWLIAEAQAKSGLPQDALNTYRAILNTDNVPKERLATIQKAMSVLPMNDVDKLVAMARTVNGKNEFSPIAIDITRGRISAYLKEERTQDIDPREMQAFEDYARGVDDPNQSSLVAWYNYNHKDYQRALDWFKISIEKGGDAMVAHGLALTLVNLKLYREAEEVAYAWRNALINNMILYVDILERDLTKTIPPYVEPERLARYGQVSMETTSGEAAQGLGWYAYNSCQYDVALQWFERAMAWFPKEATAYGYAITLEKLKRKQDEMVIVNRYDGLFYKVVELVFPDNIVRPPNPCDQMEAEQRRDRRGRRERTAFADQNIPGVDPQTQPYITQGMPAQQPQQQQPFGGNRVPSPTGAAMYGQSGYGQSGPYGQQLTEPQKMPKLNPGEFPISVNPANPLRFAALSRPSGTAGQVSGVDASVAAGSTYSGGALRFAPEPFRGPWPLVARRVPSIGPMPYERYGFTLLPAWNGVTEPTVPPYSAQNAPAGTLWADQRHADQYIAGR